MLFLNGNLCANKLVSEAVSCSYQWARMPHEENHFLLFFLLTFLHQLNLFRSINNKFNPLQGNRNDSQNEYSNDDK